MIITRYDWDTSTDLESMLLFVRDRTTPVRELTERTARLLMCAFAREIWSLITPKSQNAIEIAEQYADDLITKHHLAITHRRTNDTVICGGLLSYMCTTSLAFEKFHPQHEITQTAMYANALAKGCTTGAEPSFSTYGNSRQRNLLRDITGNPFSAPLTIRQKTCACADLSNMITQSGWHCGSCLAPYHQPWMAPAVLGLANSIYEERAWYLMPVLADALQDAGCDHTSILEHCYKWPLHTRGCWVLDILLDKK